MTATPTIDLATATPAEIDYALGPVHRRYTVALAELGQARARARRSVKYGSADTYYQDEIDRCAAEADEAEAALKAFDDEWTRRGGWTRSWLCVTSGHGHFHRTNFCQTLRNTSQLALAYSLSGLDDATLVAMAGSDACTYCYPNAPVELPAGGRRATGDVRLAEDAQQAWENLNRYGVEGALYQSTLTAIADERLSVEHAACVIADAQRHERWWYTASPRRPVVDKRTLTAARKRIEKRLAEVDVLLAQSLDTINAAAHLNWRAWKPGLVPARIEN